MHKKNTIARRNDTGFKVKKASGKIRMPFLLLLYGLILMLFPLSWLQSASTQKFQSKKIPFWTIASMVTGFSRIAL